MKNQFYILILALTMLGGIVKAQAPDNWQSMGLNMHDGTNRNNGVDGYCQVTMCNGVETVLIKLVNLNPYPIKAAWKDMVLTKSAERLSGNEPQDSITIAAGGQVAGDCTGNTPRLAIKLVEFGTDAANFANLITLDFDFAVIHPQH